MLDIGRFTSASCHNIGRRALLQAGAIGAAGLSLPMLLAAESARKSGGPIEVSSADDRAANPAADQQRVDQRPAAKAKSVILLWLWGGPSHIDTFDMKPEAPIEYRGPYRPIETRVPGMEICELLPKLAQLADRYSIIRSLHCESNDHGIAGTIGLTGSINGAISLGGQTMAGQLEPAHGSVVAKAAGPSAGLPNFIAIGDALHQGHRPIAGEGGGRLGPIQDPFLANYTPSGGVRIPNLELVNDLQPGRIDERRRLLSRFDGLRRQHEQTASVGRMDSFYAQAFDMLTSTRSREAFDLDAEPISTRNRYGRFRFGQCCLMARRLIEAGVRFVQVNWSAHVEPVEDTGDGGWDMHDRYFQQYQDRHAWMLDRSVSALLFDLQQSGLLKETIVVAVGEFGRTPKINDKAGRDHWNQCYSALVAGGGLREGQIIGASDALAEHPVQLPMTPADLFTTVFGQLGIRAPELTEIGLAPLGQMMEALV